MVMSVLEDLAKTENELDLLKQASKQWKSRLNSLVEKIKEEYRQADANYMNSSLLGGSSELGKMELCESLIRYINKTYRANYKLPETETKKFLEEVL